jgi:hypothetical protein
MAHVPYPIVCAALGLALGWLPRLLHGPIPEKFDVLYIEGSFAVWGWYVARHSIGFLVGLVAWPRPWWLRGPLVGAFAIVPLAFVSLGMPGCGWPCARINVATGAGLGFAVAGIAWLLTGKERIRQ